MSKPNFTLPPDRKRMGRILTKHPEKIKLLEKIINKTYGKSK